MASKVELKTSDFNKYFKFNLGAFIVDVVPNINFNIYDYFEIEVPNSLFEEWDFEEPFPFYCEAECSILSDGHQLICPVYVSSDQYGPPVNPIFPPISIFHFISREQHFFNWNINIELPILYRELPSNAVLSIKFYARLFDSDPKLIGESSIPIFTRMKKKFRNGPFILTFDDSPETKLQKHLRHIVTKKETSFQFIDDTFFDIVSSLHPSDSEKFFQALLDPLTPIELSSASKFAKVTIFSPYQEDPSMTVYYSPLILNSIGTSPLFNPCQKLYHDLARSQSFTKSGYMKDANLAERLNLVKSLPPLADVSSYKDLLRTFYHECLNDQALLPALFRSIKWDEDEANQVLEELKTFETIDIEYALEFFTNRYEIQPIREFAVRCISKVPREELQLYIPQILQAVKQRYTNGLTEILLSHAKEDVLFASYLYWNASIEKDDEKIGALYNSLLETVSEEVHESLMLQTNLIQSVEKFLKAAQEGSKTPQAVKDKATKLLLEDPEHSKLQHFTRTRLPFKPELFTVGINPNNIRCFQSKLKPVMLDFIIDDGTDFKVIFKIGDDMRQDQLIIQLFRVMDTIFKNASLDLLITPYATLAFSASFGCCEFVENSKAIRDIKDSETGPKTIRGFLEEESNCCNFTIQEKIERFTKSLAAYCVMTYVLKIGDRHDNNILVTRDGRLLHIDYGYILGDVTKPFTPPLKLSQEMVDVIGPDGLDQICNWAGPAFNSLRKRARLILVLIELMFTAPLNCFKEDPFSRLHKVENNLQLNCSEIEAFNVLKQAFSNSLNSMAQKLWEAVHGMAITATAPSSQ
ncbi:Phosphatidylinositol 3- and 4-kinase family protein [Histomonas meleagridis]|uniref:Phosphatidylinositol 3- and 4-kinase family protein n=1 Tax=Histomonas meleagridis TaxID=135588 RepID=UPI003559898C|nr:Phosphatidylinositol 3- and 4-kinase family protein [Histomonas meleagridis]KAH0803713.1 Phosphatidylinositol 3- and 4-kinase family protein [Histomonas meleagridis]